MSGAGQAGRGVLWLTLAKLYFMATGFLLLIFLPALFERLGGDVDGELYGRYRVVIGLVNLLNMVLIGGSLQAVSKFISEREERARAVKWQSLKIQVVLGGALSLALLLGAEMIAARLYGNPELASYLRLASPIVLLYSCYAVLIGVLNGLKRFFHQALMDILFASGKVGLTIALVVAGYAINGAIGGFLATALVMLVVSALVLGRQPRGEPFRWQTILAFEWQTLLYAFFLNAMLQVDVQMLMALAPPKLGSADSQVGIYGLALQLGQLPYIATISVAFVVFPLISRATFEGDRELTREYVSTTNRYLFLFLAGLVAAFATTAAPLLSLPFFPKVFAGGAELLSVLSVGYLFFAMVVVTANILTGSGRPALSAAIFAVMLAVATLANWLLIPMHGGLGAAVAMTVAMAVGWLVAAVLSWRHFRALIPPTSLLRGAIAAAVVVLFSVLLEPQIGGLVAVMARVLFKCLLFAAVLLLTRELTAVDWRRVAALRRRR